MTNRHPYPDPTLQEILDRNRIAHDLIDTFARSTATLNDLWQHITAALQDTPVLVAEIMRLRAQLSKNRLSRANLTAAMRATLHADADGECNPLSYLRDELADQAGHDTRSNPDGAA
ncbi:hypothetical protein E1267_39860 [Nonomuraea longispora]|uniref:Uncharacterized protein n=1 Tax=Nonomuraea longispora TaxID=1848320 RepID=A0A4R4MNH3_9ACTN|nr:hypothetical protein [Nonomuraea longispora]TDB97427.1 hypothetical protein E1267_39860 [Nonomuraea longispora]